MKAILSPVSRRIQSALLNLPAAQAVRLREDLRQTSEQRGMIMYGHAGERKVIPVTLRPWLVSPAQRRFLLRTCLTLKKHLHRLLELYLGHEDVRKVIPLSPQEEEWFRLVEKKGKIGPQTVFDRLDACIGFSGAGMEEHFQFLEPNSVGVGGVHYIPVSSEICLDVVIPRIRSALGGVRLSCPDDIRDLLMAEVIGHGRKLGRRVQRVAFLEDQSGPSGTDEYLNVGRYFERRGLEAYLADPRELHLRRGALYFKDRPIDVLYRDTEIDELIQIERGEKRPLQALKHAFVHNQVVSSLAGEFDHKSAFELFSNDAFKRFFSTSDLAFFRKHIPWTRLIWDRKTAGPDGKTVDLLSYVRRHQSRLIIKPNRAYGGKDVILGPYVSAEAWARAVERASRQPKAWVAQKSIPVQEEPYPVIDPNGRVRSDHFYVVSGFAATRNGLAILGRFSKERIVNVSRKGGLIAVLQIT